jgi:hypothetical protein
MALLVVVVLGMPQFASAGQPSVSPPDGAGKTLYNGTYYFTGPYTFDTYIACSGGAQFNSSYSNFLAGTNVFRFYGAPDGSLLVTINGGGLMLVTSCGDPLGTPDTNVATYSVAVGTPPSPPPPTATPTPSPAPKPSGGGPHGNGHGTTSTSTPTPGADATPTPTATPPAALAETPTVTPSPTPRGPGLPSRGNIGPAGPGTSSPLLNPQLIALAQRIAGWLVFALILFLVALWRSRRLRERLHAAFSTPRLRLEARWFNLRQRVRRFLRSIARALTPKRGREELKRRGLSEHRHSGRVLAHHHTSYAALLFLVILAGIVAAAASVVTHAESSSLSLTVLGPPPTTGATIDSPTDGQHFSTNSVTVQGTCPQGLLVEIYRNGTFAGSALCDTSGLYSVLITLVPGQNDLVARDADGLSQYGPDSATVTVYYDAPPPPTPTPTPSPTATPSASQAPSPSQTPSGGTATSSPRPGTSSQPPAPGTLLITTGQHLYQGTDPSTPVQWTVTISGGRAPYRLTWEWGDGSSASSPASAPGAAGQNHTYSRPGVYQVTIRATDSAGQEAVIQVVTIINGSGTIQTFGRSTPTIDRPGNLVLVWPLLIITMLIVLSMWLGERHEHAVDEQLIMPLRT